MLKNSARNSRFNFSVMGFRLITETSHSWIPGPVRILRPEFPKRGTPFVKAWDSASVTKQFTSNHCVTVLGPAPLQVRSGLGKKELVLEKSMFDRTVYGKPVWNVIIPESSQPPAKVLARPPWFKKGCPLPNGNCQMGLTTTRCLMLKSARP